MTDWGPRGWKAPVLRRALQVSELGGSSAVTATSTKPTWGLRCSGTCGTRFHKSTPSDSPHPKEIYKPAKAEPFTSVNGFSLAAFVPLLHSIPANILPSRRAGSDVQRNSSFQGKKCHSIFPTANCKFACFGAPADLNKLEKGRGALSKPRAPGMQLTRSPLMAFVSWGRPAPQKSGVCCHVLWAVQ